jgi:hypothetical protein
MSGPEQLWDVIYQLTNGETIFRHLETGALVTQLMDAWIQCSPWVIGSWLYRLRCVTINQGEHTVSVMVELIGADATVDVC